MSVIVGIKMVVLVFLNLQGYLWWRKVKGSSFTLCLKLLLIGSTGIVSMLRWNSFRSYLNLHTDLHTRHYYPFLFSKRYLNGSFYAQSTCLSVNKDTKEKLKLSTVFFYLWSPSISYTRLYLSLVLSQKQWQLCIARQNLITHLLWWQMIFCSH